MNTFFTGKPDNFSPLLVYQFPGITVFNLLAGKVDGYPKQQGKYAHILLIIPELLFPNAYKNIGKYFVGYLC
jgi:hypothetical protein